jgi:autotransporter translocation and assembly factor TamB
LLRELTAHDRDGKVQIQGRAKLLPGGGAQANLTLETDRLPVRRQGQIVGRLNLAADVNGQLDTQAKLRVDALIKEGTLQFSGATGKAVQELDPHPDVRLTSDGVPGLGASESGGVQLRALELHSKKDLWLKHRDFSVQLGLNLALRDVEGKLRLVGEADIVQGNLKLLGKSFNIQRGAVRFSPDSDEPNLDLRASFEPPGGGTPLNVQVSGRATNPALSFSGAADTTQEAFAILSGVGTNEAAQQAQADASSFGLALSAGLLSMTARQQFGAWVPTVSVGSNSRGQASQARAGFDASSLIPPALRGFARGAYVEGIVGNTQQGGPGGSVGVGVRFEIALPRSTVTTFGYGPGTNWSMDAAWVP